MNVVAVSGHSSVVAEGNSRWEGEGRRVQGESVPDCVQAGRTCPGNRTSHFIYFTASCGVPGVSAHNSTQYKYNYFKLDMNLWNK